MPRSVQSCGRDLTNTLSVQRLVYLERRRCFLGNVGSHVTERNLLDELALPVLKQPLAASVPTPVVELPADSPAVKDPARVRAEEDRVPVRRDAGRTLADGDREALASARDRCRQPGCGKSVRVSTLVRSPSPWRYNCCVPKPVPTITTLSSSVAVKALNANVSDGTPRSAQGNSWDGGSKNSLLGTRTYETVRTERVSERVYAMCEACAQGQH